MRTTRDSADHSRTIERTGYVYFIGGEQTPIKIGYSLNPHERIATLQTAHWAELYLLASIEGPPSLEARYHAMFAVDRLLGEWFQRTPLLLALIDTLKAGGCCRGCGKPIVPARLHPVPMKEER